MSVVSPISYLILAPEPFLSLSLLPHHSHCVPIWTHPIFISYKRFKILLSNPSDLWPPRMITIKCKCALAIALLKLKGPCYLRQHSNTWVDLAHKSVLSPGEFYYWQDLCGFFTQSGPLLILFLMLKRLILFYSVCSYLLEKKYFETTCYFLSQKSLFSII